MRGFLCFMCGFAEMAAIGSILSLGLPLVLSVVMLLTPVVLLVFSLVLSAWARASRERQARVYVYVPPEQRAYSGQAYRPYVEQEQRRQQYEEVW